MPLRFAPLIVALVMAAVEPAAAQAPAPPNGLRVTAFTGGVAFSGLQGVWLQPATATGGSTAAPQSGVLAPSPTATVGAGLALWKDGRWALRLEGSYTPSHLEVRLDGANGSGPGRTSNGTPTFNDVTLWTGAASALIRLPLDVGPVIAYGRAGVGVISYVLSAGAATDSASATRPFTRRTRPGGDIGVGALIPLQSSRLGLYFELSDFFCRTPITATPGGVLLRSTDLLVSRPDPGTAGSPYRIRLANNVRIIAGLSFRVAGK